MFVKTARLRDKVVLTGCRLRGRARAVVAASKEQLIKGLDLLQRRSWLGCYVATQPTE
jgi:hypothetical protein